MNIIKNLIKQHYDYISQCEKNSTEVQKTIANIKIMTDQLQAETQIRKQYFNNNLQEIDRLFKSASDLLDYAIKIGDSDIASIAIRTIEVIHKKPPFSF